MPTNNLFFAWLIENFQRWAQKSPTFVKVWRYIASLMVALTGLPDAIQWVIGKLDLTLPPVFFTLENKVVAYIGLGMAFMSMFSVQGTLTKKADGTITTDTNASKLPFTTQVQEKQLNAPPKK